MHKHLFALAALAATALLPSAAFGAGEFKPLWTHTSANPLAPGADMLAASMAFDATGNSYICGSANRGGDNWDWYVRKYGPTGAVLWTFTFDDTQELADHALDLDVDSQGNLYVCGYGNILGASTAEGLLFRLDADGEVVWTARADVAQNSGFDSFTDLGTDATGNVYVTGIGNSGDFFTLKFDATGKELWRRTEDGPAAKTGDIPRDILVDPSGECYVTGVMNTGTDTDYATVKYSADGTRMWLTRYSAAWADTASAYALARGSDGGIVVTGEAIDNDNERKVLTVKYEPNTGAQLWKLMQSANSDGVDQFRGRAVSVGKDNRIFVAGFGAINHSPRFVMSQITHDGASASFVHDPSQATTPVVNSANAVVADEFGAGYYGGGLGSGVTNNLDFFIGRRGESPRHIGWIFTNGHPNLADQATVVKLDSNGDVYAFGEMRLSATARVAYAAKYRMLVGAAHDTYHIPLNAAVNMPVAQGVMANDTGSKGATAVQVTAPQHGTLTLAADGSFTYDPQDGYTGLDTFTYKVQKSGVADSAETTVTLSIRPASSVVLLSVTANPLSVIGGHSTTGALNLDGPAPEGGLTVSLSTDSSNVIVPASKMVPGHSASVLFPISTTAVNAQVERRITAVLNGVTRSVLITLRPSFRLVISPNVINSGESTTGTVHINGVAPGAGVQVALSTDSAAISTPTSVTVAQGQSKVDFPITTTAVTSTVTRFVTATWGASVSKTALTLKAALALSSISVQPNSVVGGNPVTGTVVLNTVSGTDTTVALSDDSSAISTPLSVVVPAGQTSASFTITTDPSPTTTRRVFATFGGVTRQAFLTLVGSAVPNTLKLNPNNVVGGQSTTATLTLQGPAPAGGAVITISDNSSAITTPASVTVAEGSSETTFNVSTSPVTASATRAVIASKDGVTRMAALTVNPG